MNKEDYEMNFLFMVFRCFKNKIKAIFILGLLVFSLSGCMSKVFIENAAMEKDQFASLVGDAACGPYTTTLSYYSSCKLKIAITKIEINGIEKPWRASWLPSGNQKFTFYWQVIGFELTGKLDDSKNLFVSGCSSVIVNIVPQRKYSVGIKNGSFCVFDLGGIMEKLYIRGISSPACPINIDGGCEEII